MIDLGRLSLLTTILSLQLGDPLEDDKTLKEVGFTKTRRLPYAAFTVPPTMRLGYVLQGFFSLHNYNILTA